MLSIFIIIIIIIIINIDQLFTVRYVKECFNYYRFCNGSTNIIGMEVNLTMMISPELKGQKSYSNGSCIVTKDLNSMIDQLGQDEFELAAN